MLVRHNCPSMWLFRGVSVLMSYTSRYPPNGLWRCNYFLYHNRHTLGLEDDFQVCPDTSFTRRVYMASHVWLISLPIRYADSHNKTIISDFSPADNSLLFYAFRSCGVIGSSILHRYSIPPQSLHEGCVDLARTRTRQL